MARGTASPGGSRCEHGPENREARPVKLRLLKGICSSGWTYLADEKDAFRQDRVLP